MLYVDFDLFPALWLDSRGNCGFARFSMESSSAAVIAKGNNWFTLRSTTFLLSVRTFTEREDPSFDLIKCVMRPIDQDDLVVIQMCYEAK